MNNLEVEYECDGFLHKNKDMMMSDLKDLHTTKNEKEKSLTMPRDIAPVIERLIYSDVRPFYLLCI